MGGALASGRAIHPASVAFRRAKRWPGLVGRDFAVSILDPVGEPIKAFGQGHQLSIAAEIERPPS
jgi:hypothetical protein